MFSKVANGTCDHVWDQEFILDVPDLENSSLLFTLWCPTRVPAPVPRALSSGRCKGASREIIQSHNYREYMIYIYL